MEKTAWDLSGVRIWLSASIPDEQLETSQGEQMREFVEAFATAAFRAGAMIVHGCHPSLTPVLLKVAEAYRANTKRKAQLRLVASAYYQEADGNFANETRARLERESEFRVTPKASDRDRSLVRLRESLAAEADCLVALGGRWWQLDTSKAGVPAEFNLAIQQGIPSFLLGGLGGATEGYLDGRTDILSRLRNGLDDETNRKLSVEKDIERLQKQVFDQLSRLPLRRRETDNGERFRILSLDGGGLRGIYTASVLAAWESAAGKNPDGTDCRAASYFDLIAGTSTGGILAIGLGLGLSGQDMVNFYKKSGGSIFPTGTSLQRFFYSNRQWIRSKFSPAALEKALAEAYRIELKETGKEGRYRAANMADSDQRLLITAYNTTSDKLLLYRAHYGINNADNIPAQSVARATSAAPTYFDPAQVKDHLVDYDAVDGGVWGNCPALAALSDAVNVLGIPMDRIDLLSIGTTEMASITGTPKLLTGSFGWASKAPTLLMKAQVQATLDQVTRLLRPDRFLRVDASASTSGMDSVGDMASLNNIGRESGDQNFSEVSNRFLNGIPAAPWQTFGSSAG